METINNSFELDKHIWGDLREIILFGYGRQGKKAYIQLKLDFHICAIIDNDWRKQGGIVDNVRIVSLDSVMPLVRKERIKIIISVQESNYFQIKKQLMAEGLTERIDFISNQEFFSRWYFTFRNQIRIMKIDVPITWKCTLKCKNCMVSLPYSKYKEDFRINNIYSSLNALFSMVDYVLDMDISGGEPFLSSVLSDVIINVGERYRDRIGYMGIISNGMVIPDENILSLLKEYNICVSISDYTNVIDYKHRVQALLDVLEKYQIKYMINENVEWFDFGIMSERYRFNKKQAYRHMQLCKSVCHILDDSKVYYCSVDYGAQRSKVIDLDNNSFIDLNSMKATRDDKINLLKFILGEISETEMPRACMHCGGFGVDNNKRVIAAEQL